MGQTDGLRYSKMTPPPGRRHKTAEPIEVLFEIWTLLGPKNHILGWGLDHPKGKCNFTGRAIPRLL